MYASCHCGKGAVTLEPLTGGVSNAGFKVTDQTGTYVARLGHDYPFHQVSRSREAIAARAAHAAGLSPEVVHTEDGVMVLRYIAAKTYAEADVRQNWQACVDIVKRCHREMPRRILGQGAIFWVFQIIRDYGATLQAKNHRLRWRSAALAEDHRCIGSRPGAAAHHLRPP